MPFGPTRTVLLGVENSDGTVTGVTTGTSPPKLLEGLSLVTVWLRSAGTGVTSGGTVVIEEADWGPLETVYSGTWSTLLSQAASGLTGLVMLAVNISPKSTRYLRVRVSSTITGGGTVFVALTGMTA